MLVASALVSAYYHLTPGLLAPGLLPLSLLSNASPSPSHIVITEMPVSCWRLSRSPAEPLRGLPSLWPARHHFLGRFPLLFPQPARTLGWCSTCVLTLSDRRGHALAGLCPEYNPSLFTGQSSANSAARLCLQTLSRRQLALLHNCQQRVSTWGRICRIVCW